MFKFQGNLMKAQDIGNHHFWAVGKAYGLFSEKGLVSGATFSLEIKGQAKIEVSGLAYEDSITMTNKFEGKAEAKVNNPRGGKVVMPSEEYTVGGSGASVSGNPKEFMRTASDAFDGIKKYIQVEVENIKKALNVKTIRILNAVSSIYLLISGVICLFFLAVSLYQNEISGILWLTMPLCIAIVLIITINNYNILRSISKINKTNLLINILIALAQVIYVAFNGFQFKYNQGFQIVAYVKIFNDSKEVKATLFFNNFNYLLNIKFLELDYSAFGIDLLALFLFLFYLYQYRNYTLNNPQINSSL